VFTANAKKDSTLKLNNQNGIGNIINTVTKSPSNNISVGKPILESKLENNVPDSLSVPLLQKADITKKRIEPYNETIKKLSAKYGVPTEVIKSIIALESTGNANVKGATGEVGLMQISPGTAKSYGITDTNSLYNIQTNIETGIKHIEYIRKFLGYEKDDYKNPNKLKYILAAYNAGHGRLKEIGDKIFNIPITKKYVLNSLALLKHYRW